MSGDPLVEMEARILAAIATSEKRLRAALGQSMAEIMERLTVLDAEYRGVRLRLDALETGQRARRSDDFRP